jgi:hypothetical protein
MLGTRQCTVYCFKTFTHSPGFSLSATPDSSSFPQATGTLVNYMDIIVIKSRVSAWFIVLGLG